VRANPWLAVGGDQVRGQVDEDPAGPFQRLVAHGQKEVGQGQGLAPESVEHVEDDGQLVTPAADETEVSPALDHPVEAPRAVQGFGQGEAGSVTGERQRRRHQVGAVRMLQERPRLGLAGGHAEPPGVAGATGGLLTGRQQVHLPGAGVGGVRSRGVLVAGPEVLKELRGEGVRRGLVGLPGVLLLAVAGLGAIAVGG